MPQPDVRALIAKGQADYSALARKAAATAIETNDPEVEALANTVAELAAQCRGLLTIVGTMAGSTPELPVVKRLPQWAMRQSVDGQRWLAQLPQDVLDSPYLEVSFQAMAAGGMMANNNTLAVLEGRVRAHERHAAAVKPAVEGVSVWRGEQTMGPFACPRCGSVGTGSGMTAHLAAEHADCAGGHFYCTACAESHELPVATAQEPCPRRGGFSGVRA